jgi:hypothetical protein
MNTQTSPHADTPHITPNGKTHTFVSPTDIQTVLANAKFVKAGLLAPHPDIAKADWDMLFTATKARLVSIAHEQQHALLATAVIGTTERSGLTPNPDRFHHGVLECVDALDQLHATIRHEFN